MPMITETPPIRVIIADDHPVIREGLAAILPILGQKLLSRFSYGCLVTKQSNAPSQSIKHRIQANMTIGGLLASVSLTVFIVPSAVYLVYRNRKRVNAPKAIAH